jgi:hypothetical protein
MKITASAEACARHTATPPCVLNGLLKGQWSRLHIGGGVHTRTATLISFSLDLTYDSTRTQKGTRPEKRNIKSDQLNISVPKPRSCCPDENKRLFATLDCFARAY